jgi:hypothetical protein
LVQALLRPALLLLSMPRPQQAPPPQVPTK